MNYRNIFETAQTSLSRNVRKHTPSNVLIDLPNFSVSISIHGDKMLIDQKGDISEADLLYELRVSFEHVEDYIRKRYVNGMQTINGNSVNITDDLIHFMYLDFVLQDGGGVFKDKYYTPYEILKLVL